MAGGNISGEPLRLAIYTELKIPCGQYDPASSSQPNPREFAALQ